ncbi:MAG TPA: hypothetical protein VFW96_16645 [Thermomicrobiales bacterium]|nr:hypothetical protein [Thermomicrobiales bacterium]
MTNTAEPSWLVEHGHADPIRIVPLHLPGAAPAPTPPPQLTYRGGPLIHAVEVFTVFWGAAWQRAPQDALARQLNQFFDTILTSALLDQLAEYNVAGQTIGYGRRVGTTTLTTPAPRRSVSDTALQRLLREQLAGNAAFPQPSANTLYFLYLPPGTTVTQGGSRSCQAFCGYHNDIAGQIFYAVMPYPGCAGCVGGLAPSDALTSTSSHELCEAITDPIPGQGWYDDTHGEIGDICAWRTKQLAGYTVQLEWSNRQGACV